LRRITIKYIDIYKNIEKKIIIINIIILFLIIKLILFLDPINSSSTVQGGGGNFKNRTFIGKVGCWELRITE